MTIIYVENRSYLARHLTLFKYLLKNEFHGPFLWIGFNCLKAAESLQGESLLLTTRSRGILGTPLIHLGKMKGCAELGVNPWDRVSIPAP